MGLVLDVHRCSTGVKSLPLSINCYICLSKTAEKLRFDAPCPGFASCASLVSVGSRYRQGVRTFDVRNAWHRMACASDRGAVG